MTKIDMPKDVKDQFEYDQRLSSMWALDIYSYKPKAYKEFIMNYPILEEMKKELSKYMDGITFEKGCIEDSTLDKKILIFVQSKEYLDNKELDEQLRIKNLIEEDFPSIMA